ncbi:MAG TPA: class I SAM-dependent methyltransferase [Longimicrobiales bacterium]|nr:class I SAM-dependent methyltransferase [Longimicrobiales bacterium]
MKLATARARLERLAAVLLARVRPVRAKRLGELAFWRERHAVEGRLVNHHYAALFTDHFALPADHFRGLEILDIGCGPRGSLEWAEGATVRIGLDPLALEYRAFGTTAHEMDYVAASSDRLPFASSSLDMVSAFNALDHVEDLEGTLAEVARVLRPGGDFLLLVDVNHEPTVLEPLNLSWELPLRDRFREVRVRHYERHADGTLATLRKARPFDHDDPRPRPGMLSAHLTVT